MAFIGSLHSKGPILMLPHAGDELLVQQVRQVVVAQCTVTDCRVNRITRAPWVLATLRTYLEQQLSPDAGRQMMR